MTSCSMQQNIIQQIEVNVIKYGQLLEINVNSHQFYSQTEGCSTTIYRSPNVYFS